MLDFNFDLNTGGELDVHKCINNLLRLIDIIKPSQKTIDALMSVELPAGVEIEIKL